MATQDRSWLRTVQFRIGRTWKRLLLLFFFFKLLLLSLRGSSGQVLALRVQKWSCRCYMRLSSAFFRPCFSKKLPTTCSEQCCSLVVLVVQRIFQHIKKTSASLGSVFSLSSFSFSFWLWSRWDCFFFRSHFVRRMIGRSVMVNLYSWS